MHLWANESPLASFFATAIYIQDDIIYKGERGGVTRMVSLMIEANGPDHGMERYKVKIIKKYNMDPGKILPKYRTRPAYELSGIIIGKNVSYETAREYLLQYLDESARLASIMSIRLQK